MWRGWTIGTTCPCWSSQPDSGYSVDNLPPVAPAPFTGTFVAGSGAFLDWGPNAESDLAGYRLYGGLTPGFVPGPSNRIYLGAVNYFHDPASHEAVYKVCAYDIHGNGGVCTVVTPSGSVGVDPRGLPKALAFALASGDATRGAPEFRLALPHGARVSPAIYDAQGREVRNLVDEWREAGEFTVRWDGLDGSGAASSSGVYFAWMRAEGREFVRRMVSLR